MLKKIILFILFGGIVIAGLIGFKAYQFLNTPTSSDPSEIVFEIKPGPFQKIADELFKKKLISSRKKFIYFARITDQSMKVRVGEYLLRKNMLPQEILSVLVSGKMLQHEFTLQEGANIYELADILANKSLVDKQEFLQLVKSESLIKKLLGEAQDSLEGYLFPDTYRVTKYDGAQKIIETMVKKFLSIYQEVSQGVETELPFNRHQVVTLASMIEKETGASFERPLISSVFINRLRKPMRLQSDPTILYGIMERDGVWKQNIQKKDILEYTPYNTYRVNALPKGPISNPGKESLRAVFYPEESNYIYFVSRNDGTHIFSESLKDHNKAVKKFQLDVKARKGKSWRDLKK